MSREASNLYLCRYVMPRPISKAEAAGHDCKASRCAEAKHVASQVHVRWLDLQREERSARLMDNLDRKGVTCYAFLGLTDADMANLAALSEADGRVKNYAVLIRRLIAREAKALD